jgi:hypothetical protein
MVGASTIPLPAICDTINPKLWKERNLFIKMYHHSVNVSTNQCLQIENVQSRAIICYIQLTI